MAIKTDTTLQNALKTDPVGTMDNVTIQVPDTLVYRLVVISLVVTVSLIVIGLLIIAISDKAAGNQSILTIFTAIASTAIGALAGVLIPAEKNESPE